MSVVVGYIPDKYGEAALREAMLEAVRRSTGVVVVNASRGDSLVDKRYVGEQARTQLEERLSAASVEVELRQAIGTDVAAEILAVAHEVAAEALVIGIRHRSQVGKMLMGSVATRLLMEAPCPVIAVKP